MRKGKYKFKGSETFGKDNKFNLNSFVNKEFSFYGADEIRLIFYHPFVSKVGSKILFVHKYKSNDDTLPPMFIHGKTRPL